MFSKNIFKACLKHGMRPVCDKTHYRDGLCEVIGHGWMYHHGHFSHNHHTNHHDRNKHTLCTKASNTNGVKIKWRGQMLERVQVTTKINSQSILAACKKRGMKPVCDHRNYNDRKCHSFG